MQQAQMQAVVKLIEAHVSALPEGQDVIVKQSTVVGPFGEVLNSGIAITCQKKYSYAGRSEPEGIASSSIARAKR